MANSPRCVSRQKANIKAGKERKLRKRIEKEKEKLASKDGDDMGERDGRLEPELEIVLEAESWAKSPTSERLDYRTPES